MSLYLPEFLEKSNAINVGVTAVFTAAAAFTLASGWGGLAIGFAVASGLAGFESARHVKKQSQKDLKAPVPIEHVDIWPPVGWASVFGLGAGLHLQQTMTNDWMAAADSYSILVIPVAYCGTRIYDAYKKYDKAMQEHAEQALNPNANTPS
ncbi:MAG: hypothetical protein MRY79_08925 [Alphaproteobacteria bacterium]|nr:hypothetical protein [Alphaproteobacteria bacterium]